MLGREREGPSPLSRKESQKRHGHCYGISKTGEIIAAATQPDYTNDPIPSATTMSKHAGDLGQDKSKADQLSENGKPSE